MFIRFLLLSVVLLCGGFLLYIESYYQENKINPIYNDFEGAIKSENYLEAHKVIYPHVKNLEKEALKLVSESYLYGLGVEKDLIKHSIWKARSECGCLETGREEYKKYQDYFQNKDYESASLFLIKSAEKGNAKAIEALKNNDFIEKSKLIIDRKSKKCWEGFDDNDLYPFCDEIDECKRI